MSGIKAYLEEKKGMVDSFLESYFSGGPRPRTLAESMAYSLMAGGKRLRPVLAMAACEAVGGEASDVVGYASALEMIHTYSLIHDDLPAMDDDDLRRGRPTNHKVYGEGMAVLAGDALLTEAFAVLSTPSSAVGSARLVRAVREVAEASGARGMVGGQAEDLLSEGAPPDEDTLTFIHMHKTAALIRASVALGGILAGAKKSDMTALNEYGWRLGLAFQIIDDILDIEGDEETLGKPVGSDMKNKKMTYPSLHGLDASRKKAEALINEAVSALSDFGKAAGPLREIARYMLKRKN